MSAPASLASVYCTDEDIAALAPRDFFLLCPTWQRLAFGVDGAIAAGAWSLTSAGTNFATNGVGANSVVNLKKPGAFRADGDLFAVDSVAGGSAVLRRIGQPLNIGQAPTAVALAGVTFEVRTFARQIDNSSYEINESYGINATVAGRRPSDMYDVRELQRCVALAVLVDAYVDADKQSSGDFDMKLKLRASQLSDVRSRLQLRWTQWRGERSTGRFTTRIGR